MEAEMQAFRKSLEGLTREQLIEKLIQAHEELNQAQAQAKENGRISVAMTREHQRTLKDLEETKEELKKVKATCKKQAERIQALCKNRFGRHSETSEALYTDSGEENPDPLDEEMESETIPLPPINFESAARKLAGQKKRKRVRPIGKREDDISGLEKVNIFDLDVEELDEKYGPDGWELVNWHKSIHVVHVKEYYTLRSGTSRFIRT